MCSSLIAVMKAIVYQTHLLHTDPLSKIIRFIKSDYFAGNCAYFFFSYIIYHVLY